MNESFVDANIFLRFLTNDIPTQAQAVEQLLQQAAQGKITLRTSTLVLAEIAWTLEFYYETPREQVKRKILAILNTPGLRVENADLLTEAAILYAEKNVDFIDAYNACWMKKHGLSRIYTFDDKHFSPLEGITLLIPTGRTSGAGGGI